MSGEPGVSRSAGLCVGGQVLGYGCRSTMDFLGALSLCCAVQAVCIGWTINFMIFVSTVAFCFETLDSMSMDPHRNPLGHDKWKSRWCGFAIAPMRLRPSVGRGARARLLV
eukprot:SAG31_NODE_276_length_18650_cov_5.821842_16_plen_111_part_00